MRRGPKPGLKAKLRAIRATPGGEPGPEWATPDHLPDAAVEAFERARDVLNRAGMLGHVLPTLVECYAECVWMTRQAYDSISLDGITMQGANGGIIANPACGIYDRAARQVRSLSKAIGLNEAYEILATKGARQDDPLAAFLSRGREIPGEE